MAHLPKLKSKVKKQTEIVGSPVPTRRWKKKKLEAVSVHVFKL